SIFAGCTSAPGTQLPPTSSTGSSSIDQASSFGMPGPSITPGSIFGKSVAYTETAAPIAADLGKDFSLSEIANLKEME
ncbi:hypothetical protein, partial [Megamonas rupellensis]|uniref:hypothetical protein n=1 Tax=Megamonas rupellensis TaxID=491921 RepID=UPI001956A926